MTSELLLFIEQIVEQEITELAVAPEQASSEKLALLVSKNGKEIEIVLYSPDSFREACELKLSGITNKAIIKQVKPIVGAVSLFRQEKCGTWEVTSAVAEKGYGPLMYDIAFSFAGNEGVMSDRATVSPTAKNVWRYNMTKRRNDFDIDKLAPNCLFSGKNDEEFLNYKFTLKNPINTSALEAAHHQTIDGLEYYYGKKELDIKDFLIELATRYFITKYHDLP